MPKGYTHVTREERSQIYALKSISTSLRVIAATLKRHVSTISRELVRNKGIGKYSFKLADRKAKKRRSFASRRPKKMAGITKRKVLRGLKFGWSPEQISGRLALEGFRISHEAIYQYVWSDKKQGGNLHQHLRRKGKRYNKRGALTAGRGLIPGRVGIEDRPQVVDNKSRIGDWEGDTIIGAKHDGAIVSYVDRFSKYTLLRKVAGKRSDLVFKATIQKMRTLPHPVHTITFDNGKEFARHKQISKELGAKCYFATPYHSWERGLNEHTNGLVRQYLPKSTLFKNVSHSLVQKIENALNHRPRKVLNYRTPFEVFFSAIQSDSSVALQR